MAGLTSYKCICKVGFIVEIIFLNFLRILWEGGHGNERMLGGGLGT